MNTVHAHYRPGRKGVMLTGPNVGQGRKPAQSKDADKQTSTDYEPWGEQNDYPQWVMDSIKDVSLVKPILAWKSEALYGGGISYGLERWENGREILEPLFLPEIDDWLEATDVDQYLMEATSNFYHFYNFFPELTQSLDGSQINFLSCKESTDSRWGRRNPQGYIDKMYLSPDWATYNEKSKETAKFDVINPYRHRIEDIKASWRNKAMILPVSFPSPGKAYYQEAPWHVLIKSWLPIAKMIPEYKKFIMENIYEVRYLIEVPEWYWKEKYPKWGSLGEKERLKIIDDEHDWFDNFFKKENAGNSLMVLNKDAHQGHTPASWKITSPENHMKEGMYIEDSQEADAHIFKNLAVDSTLFGNAPGKNNASAGSGSDKRVARNSYMIQTKPHQNLILKPLQYIARYNGWKEQQQKKGGRFTFWFKNYMIARLDEGKETKSEK